VIDKGADVGGGPSGIVEGAAIGSVVNAASVFYGQRVMPGVDKLPIRRIDNTGVTLNASKRLLPPA